MNLASLVAWFGKYRPTITAVTGIVIWALVAEYGTGNKWVQAAIGVATAAGVYAGKAKAQRDTPAPQNTQESPSQPVKPDH